MGRPQLRSEDYRAGYLAGYDSARRTARTVGRASVSGSARSIRFRDDEAEMRCSYCLEWWPITAEFWRPSHGTKRCKACWAHYHRLHEAGYRASDAVKEMRREAARLRHSEKRRERNEASRRWREANRERVTAYNRAYRERNRERINEKQRQYHAENRDVELVKRRAAYRQKAYDSWATAA